MSTQFISSSSASNSNFGSDSSGTTGETARFIGIARRHVRASGEERSKLRGVLVEYLRYSTTSNDLINELICFCVELRDPRRLDIGVDILSQLDKQIYSYAYNFLVDDIKNWSHLYPGRSYEPNDDSWYILLKSVARSSVADEQKLSFVSMCKDAESRGMKEAVVEALSDLDTDEARKLLARFTEDGDPFIAKLALQELDQD